VEQGAGAPQQQVAYGTASAWAPGWYPVAPGTFGWWDGHGWSGHYHSVAPPRSDEDAGAFTASLAWWASLFAGLWPALIVFIINSPDKAGSNRFARFSAGEALNFHLTVLVATIPVYAVFMGVVFSTFYRSFEGTGTSTAEASGPGAAFAASFGIVWVLVMALSLGTTIVYILAAVRANKGVWWHARYTIPFLRAHRLLAPTA
jgi:uncharacterized Tic20 family protein